MDVTTGSPALKSSRGSKQVASLDIPDIAKPSEASYSCTVYTV